MEMKSLTGKLWAAIRRLSREDGQDLVEYALVVALIAFAATSGEKTLARDINSVFSQLATELTSATA
jgi:pilus assembly protein Flp/PilA